jgi:prevent-host-death family protein
MTTITLSEARKNFPEIVEKSHKLFKEYVISKKGVPTAVLVDYEIYESMKETLRISLDKKLSSRLRKARQEMRSGQGREWKTFKKDLGL